MCMLRVAQIISHAYTPTLYYRKVKKWSLAPVKIEDLGFVHLSLFTGSIVLSGPNSMKLTDNVETA